HSDGEQNPNELIEEGNSTAGNLVNWCNRVRVIKWLSVVRKRHRVSLIAKPIDRKTESRASHPQNTALFQPVRSPLKRILFLQRTIGNHASRRLISSGALGAKLLQRDTPGARVGPQIKDKPGAKLSSMEAVHLLELKIVAEDGLFN